MDRLDKIQQIEGRLKQDQEILKKYDRKGIYSISIGDKLVYIGKSKNMLNRIANHIFYIQNLNYTKSHKYLILNQALQSGLKINFDVMEYLPKLILVDDDEEDCVDGWLGRAEGRLIREHLPPLNYQIPREDNYHKYTVNKQATKITLEEILG